MRINLQSRKDTKKTMRHQNIASAVHEGEPCVMARSQKYIPSRKLSTDIQPMVVLVVSGFTSYFLITFYLKHAANIIKITQ